jgi:predicted nucleotidyltransferase
LLDFKHPWKTERSEVIPYFCIFVAMNALIENQLQKIRDLCYEHQVETLHVFGSVLSEDFSVESDIDILIQFQEMSHEQYAEYYFSLHEKLEQLFGRKVDLLTQRSLSNPYFIAKVERTKKLLYAA